MGTVEKYREQSPTLDFSPTANFDIILPSLRHNQPIVRNLLNEP